MNVTTTMKRMISSFRQINMTEPHLWYRKARVMSPRRVVVHIGPTNSGKTYSALKALGCASTGIYLGPLRLLAWEVYEKLGNVGVRCGLLTGQEREFPENYTHIACTIEMADLNRHFDTAVIDEGQLIGDKHRGWAWTSAFLGVCAHEIHICGSKTLLPVIKKLCKKTGDELSVNHYNRLSSLSVESKSLRKFSNIEPGDCVIGFSRKQLYKMKYKIERKCQDREIKCCVIYGNLPPEARQAQARLFNDESSGYDVLVASDAIGMGLNLSIKRIVFSTVEKYDGSKTRNLYSQEIKQIAGRAGRYGTKFEDGLVTCMSKYHLHFLKTAMREGEDEDVQTAGLFPSQEQLRLLGIMMDYNVGNEALTRFQLHEESMKWGIQGGGNERKKGLKNSSGQHGFDVELIKSKFDGFSNFIRHFEDYLIEGDEIEYVNRVKRIRKKKRIRQKERSYRYMSDDSTTYDDDDHDDDGDYNDPLSGLSQLYRRFQSAAELGTSGTYFLCNLKDNIELAEILDRLPMTFSEKFIFSMAPVDLDNEIMMRSFERFARDFAHIDEVLINEAQARSIVEMTKEIKRTQDVKFIVKTPEELMKFEVYHKVYDLYRWLGQRFEYQFADMELAVECANCTGYIVGEALRVLGPEFTEKRDRFKGKLENRYKRRSTDTFSDGYDDDNDFHENEVEENFLRDIEEDLYSFSNRGDGNGSGKKLRRRKRREGRGRRGKREDRREQNLYTL